MGTPQRRWRGPRLPFCVKVEEEGPPEAPAAEDQADAAPEAPRAPAQVSVLLSKSVILTTVLHFGTTVLYNCSCCSCMVLLSTKIWKILGTVPQV